MRALRGARSRRSWSLLLALGCAAGLAAAPAAAQPDGSLELELELQPETLSSTGPVGPPGREQVKALRHRLQSAGRTLAALCRRDGALFADTRLSLEGELARLERLLGRRRLRCNPAPEVGRLEEDLALAAAGDTPYTRQGLHRMAYRSPLDGRMHQFVVFVPPGYSSRRPWPLVVMLHGMRSTPMRAVGRLFGVDDARLDEAHVTCDRPTLKPRPTLVVAPDGFGDAFFRLLGERDVHHVVQRVMRLFRVDRSRVTITGLSMGGTAAVELALQRPHLYAGVLALCGYYDRRLDSSIRGRPLLPWEQHMKSLYSAVDWVPNGRALPLHLIHGSRDGPQRARVLERRYRELGFTVQVEMHPRGHDVWTSGYAGGRGLDLLARLRKDQRPPARVTLVSARSRVRRAHWVQIEQFADYARWGRVDAEIQDRDRVQVRTSNVKELRLDLPRRLVVRGRIGLQIDGQRVAIAPARGRGMRTVRLLRGRATWSTVDARQAHGDGLAKRPGLAGPIEDIYFDPILVVYGTGGGQAAHLRRVAKKLARYDRRVDVRYPLLPDRRYSARRARGHSVILVGNEQTNSVLARLGPRLPIRVSERVVRLGARSVRGEDVGASYIYPNPDAPSWYVRVVGGTTPRSYELFDELPKYLPDYVVFDGKIDGAGGGKLVGEGRSLVAAGYFDGGWQLPAAR